MSYVVPSVLVYQQLANSGGVANVTPDLDAAIVGPCYTVVEYDGTSAEALITSAALTNTGEAYALTDNGINNVVNLPSQKPGQDVEESSVEVYINNAVVETLSTMFVFTDRSNVIGMGPATYTAAVASADDPVITGLPSGHHLVVGDPVTVTGAGVAGAVLVGTIIAVESTSVMLDTDARTSVTGATITKTQISNINSVTSTRRVEPGDAVSFTFTNNNVVHAFSSTVTAVESLAGVITQITLADMVDIGSAGMAKVHFYKRYNNQLLLAAYDGYPNYTTTSVGADGKVTILPKPKLAYGTVVAADVHVAYRALRTDLAGSIVDVEDISDLEGKLGKPSERNPLALGVQLALANTTGRVLAIATPSNDLAGYQAALELAEGRRIYALAPLTQDLDILTMFKLHVEAMSTPESALWRVAAINSAIPNTRSMGEWNVNHVNANGGNNAISLISGKYVLTASNATFLSDGCVPGDIVHITAGTGSPSPIGTLQILNVINNQQVQVNATRVSTGVSYYVTRNLTKAQKADVVAGLSRTLASNRVTHIPQGAGVTVDGVTKYLPGYYLCAAYVGLISGLPVQQSLTNIGMAGIVDVQFGNFYFTRAQLSTMAEAGTCLIVQESQGSIPYSRHSLTTDMTALYLREIQLVKNWDYLSYFFYDILRGFVGRYNITADTLRILGQSIAAGGSMMQGKVLPKLGAPLVDFSIKTLKQDENNLDSVIVELPIKMPVVMNYLNLYLVV